MTHRQYLLWQEWRQAEWDRPSREDWYLMQIAAEVRRGRAKHPRGVKLEHLRLRPEGAKPPVSREAAAAAGKARWTGRMTMPVTVVRVPRQ